MDEAKLEALAGIIRRASNNAYRATLVGNPAPIVKEMYEHMRSIAPGALVFETTTVYRSSTRNVDAVGFLIKEVREPVTWGDPDFKWDEEAEGRPEPTERCFYIRTFDDREFRWVNAEFVRVPDWLRDSDMRAIARIDTRSDKTPEAA